MSGIWNERYIASPTPRSPRRKRRNAAGIHGSHSEQSDFDNHGTNNHAGPLTTFPIGKLPRELRCMVWEWVVLHDSIAALGPHPNLPPTEEETNLVSALRRCIPGYYRPTALVMRDRDVFRPRDRHFFLLDRLPALFLVSKETYLEAREVAFRHLIVEIDQEICRDVLFAWSGRMNNPMLTNLRNLYISTMAKVPRPDGWSAQLLPFAGSWPILEFDWRRVPLFHISIPTDGSSLTLTAQRDFVRSDRHKLDTAIKTWCSKLDPNHRFSNQDLVHMAKIIHGAQLQIVDHSWTMRLDEKDKAAQKAAMAAQDMNEQKTGDREWRDGWMKIDDEFRVTIVKITAPCLEDKVKSKGWVQTLIESPKKLLGF